MGTIGHVTPLTDAAQRALTAHSHAPEVLGVVALCVLVACVWGAVREGRT